MADRQIGSLPKATEMDEESLLVVEQQNTAKSITGELVAQYAREATEGYANDAKASADKAKQDADRAKGYADTIEIDYDYIEEARTDAQTSATEAAGSAAAALKSQQAASQSEKNAASSETKAKASQDAALASQTAASTSASQAATSATNAAAFAKTATDKASAASTSATNAASSASQAATSASNAADSEEAAAASQTAAKASENAAKSSQTEAAKSATAAAASQTAAATSQSEAKKSETAAASSKDAAATSASNASKSETAAKSSQTAAANSATAASGSASAAEKSASAAAASASSAATQAKTAQSYVEGGTSTRPGEDGDNAKYYYEQAKRIAEGLQGALLPMGNIKFAELANADKIPGNMYNVTDAFTTDATFKEGAGHPYAAGTNVYWTVDGFWDALPGIQVTGVKGHAEGTYRLGQVDITPANIGLANVDNTHDSAKNVLSATKLTTARQLGVNLARTAASTFDGSANQLEIPVKGVLPVANGGTGNATGKAPTAGAADTAAKLATPRNINGIAFDGSKDITVYDSTKVAKTGDTMTGDLTLSGTSRAIKYASGTRTNAPISFYAGDVNGSGIVIGDGGRTIIGGGESAQSLRTALGTGTSNESAEEMHVASDGSIFLHTNCQTIGSRKTVTINGSGNVSAPGGFSGNLTGKATTAGAADTAVKLSTPRSLKTNLGSTAAITFDGSADQNSIPVTGTLPVGNGGTGRTSISNITANLASTTAGNALAGNIGVSGILPVTHGGTGNATGKAPTAGVADSALHLTSYALAASTDLNNITDPGFYYCNSSATVATFKNCPTQLALAMIVVQNAPVSQIIIEYRAGGQKIYERNYYEYDNKWSDWMRLYTTQDRPTASEVGAFPSTAIIPIANGGTGRTFLWGEGGAFEQVFNKTINDPQFLCVFTTGWEDAGYMNQYGARQWLNINNVDNTPDSQKNVNYAINAEHAGNADKLGGKSASDFAPMATLTQTTSFGTVARALGIGNWVPESLDNFANNLVSSLGNNTTGFIPVESTNALGSITGILYYKLNNSYYCGIAISYSTALETVRFSYTNGQYSVRKI